MIVRLAAVVVILVLLTAATGVRVATLWPQQPELPQPPEQSRPSQVSANARTDVPDIEGKSLLAHFYDRLHRSPDDFEAALVRALLLFQEGALDEAIDQLRSLTEKTPRFELAHLILGDLLLARFAPIDSIGAQAVVDHEGGSRQQRMAELRSEARARLQGYLSLLNVNKYPRALIALSRTTEYALMIDKSKNRLYVYQNKDPESPPELVDDFYIVLGRQVGDKYYEGDLRTPTGTYFVTGYLAPESLPPLYGNGAFPINYPNEYDRRRKKTGYGIWLHGTDRALFSRPPLDSEGCVVLTNEEFERIRRYVRVGHTPVIIGEELEWLSEESWIRQRQEITSVLEQWRQRWENGDLDAYLQMYAEDFWTSQHDGKSWKNYKKQVFSGKTFQQVAVSDLSLFGYPRSQDETPLIVANFVQHYRSNNYNGDMRKLMYLVKEQGAWKVLYEGNQR